MQIRGLLLEQDVKLNKNGVCILPIANMIERSNIIEVFISN